MQTSFLVKGREGVKELSGRERKSRWKVGQEKVAPSARMLSIDVLVPPRICREISMGNHRFAPLSFASLLLFFQYSSFDVVQWSTQ